MCVIVCCRVFQCVTVVTMFCCLLPCVAVCCSELQCVTVRYIVNISRAAPTAFDQIAVKDSIYSVCVLQCVTVSCSMLQCVQCVVMCSNVLQRVTVCWSVLECVAECWSVLECVAVQGSIQCVFHTQQHTATHGNTFHTDIAGNISHLHSGSE